LKVEGSYSFEAPRQEVWDALMSPDVLAGCIPGCQRLDAAGEDSYEMVLKVGVAAITGTYKGTVSIVDKVGQESYRMIVEGKGVAGGVRGEGMVRLTEDGAGTAVTFEGEARVTGIIARVGQRLMGNTSKLLINQFFNCLKSRTESP
jgi:carbon monoxide dehydrogenase subunit G